MKKIIILTLLGALSFAQAAANIQNEAIVGKLERILSRNELLQKKEELLKGLSNIDSQLEDAQTSVEDTTLLADDKKADAKAAKADDGKGKAKDDKKDDKKDAKKAKGGLAMAGKKSIAGGLAVVQGAGKNSLASLDKKVVIKAAKGSNGAKLSDKVIKGDQAAVAAALKKYNGVVKANIQKASKSLEASKKVLAADKKAGEKAEVLEADKRLVAKKEQLLDLEEKEVKVAAGLQNEKKDIKNKNAAQLKQDKIQVNVDAKEHVAKEAKIATKITEAALIQQRAKKLWDAAAKTAKLLAQRQADQAKAEAALEKAQRQLKNKTRFTAMIIGVGAGLLIFLIYGSWFVCFKKEKIDEQLSKMEGGYDDNYVKFIDRELSS